MCRLEKYITKLIETVCVNLVTPPLFSMGPQYNRVCVCVFSLSGKAGADLTTVAVSDRDILHQATDSDRRSEEESVCAGGGRGGSLGL